MSKDELHNAPDHESFSSGDAPTHAANDLGEQGPPGGEAPARAENAADVAVATRRFQDLVSDAAVYGQEAISRHVSAMTALSKAKSPQEVLQIQADYSRSAIEAFLAHSSRMTRVMSELVSGSAAGVEEQAQNLTRLADHARRNWR